MDDKNYLDVNNSELPVPSRIYLFFWSVRLKLMSKEAREAEFQRITTRLAELEQQAENEPQESPKV